MNLPQKKDEGKRIALGALEEVRLSHVESMKTALGCTSADIWNLLGQNRARVTLKETELVPPSIGMQVRLFRDYPEYARIPKPVNNAIKIVEEIAERLVHHPICVRLTAKGRARLVVSMLGIHPTASARLGPNNWRGSGAVGPAATRLLQLYLHRENEADRQQFVMRWVDVFLEELKARKKTLEEVTKKGWNVRTRSPRIKEE